MGALRTPELEHVGLKKLTKMEKKNSILAKTVSNKSSAFLILNCVSH